MYKKILITGASGFIARLIIPYIRSKGYIVRGFDLLCSRVETDEFFIGSFENLKEITQAAKNIDIIIHLGGISDEDDFSTRLIPVNLIGTYNVLQAAKFQKVKKVILASSIQTVNLTHLENSEKLIDTSERSPCNFYGLVKLWIEDLGKLFADLYDLPVIVARIGWVIKNKKELKEIESHPFGKYIYLSHNDARLFFLKSIEISGVKYLKVYVLSKDGSKKFEVNKNKEILKFEPKDNFLEGLDSNVMEE